MIRFKIEGLEQLQKELKAMPKRVQNEMGRAMRDEADGVLAKAQELVPVDTGYLYSTGEVAERSVNQHRTDLSVEYGAEYAQFVHDIPGRPGYRWLARAFQARMNGLTKRITDRLRRALEKR